MVSENMTMNGQICSYAKIYDKNYKSIKGSAAKSTHTVQFENAANTINKYNMQHVLLKI